ncbi:hypothetical protein J6590_098219, partial [Homalodisca vitripennis]
MAGGKEAVKSDNLQCKFDFLGLEPPMSEEEDTEITDTRPKLAKALRTTHLNINSGKVSSLHSKDLKNVETLKIFSFSPDETPLLST